MEFNLPKTEEQILKFWKKNKVFEKSVNLRPKNRKFVFFEGPPTANGRPGIHHVLARVFKDIICRYKTMQGFRVERKAGWDTHGLPVELEVEKKLGIKRKPEIEEYGIAKFNKECKKSVWQYKKEWEQLTERIGYWVDLKNAYITYENYYIESVWWVLKQIWDKNLLYQDYRVSPYCPRCETGLSGHEVAQGYKKVKENSIYIKLKVKKEPNTYLLVWTTTPWTLPSNVAVAINPELIYIKVKILEDILILAKNRINVLGEGIQIIEEFSGKKLLGLEYEPIFDFKKPDKKSYFVISGKFVSAEDGTGLVHIAPAFGEDDMRVGKENNLPVLMTVDLEGKFIPEIKPWAGLFVKDADPLIVQNLKNKKILFKEELYEHDYPFCWRCKSPLLYYAKESWFIRMQEVNKKMVEENKKINWNPKHLKEGRFGEWIKEAKDWNLSRERYWGTPLPIWVCEKCKAKVCIGSIKELFQKSKIKPKDLHRPYVDKITFKCKECGGKMKRIKELADVWFDSGSMPFSQSHYPFENKKLIDNREQFPAEYISEAIDQTRGWFYTLLAISNLLGFEAPYKNVISLGHILDEKGEKMSKSRGNIVNPWDMIQKYGVDILRWYFYTINQPGESKLFSEKDVDGCLKRFLMIFWNCFVFQETYKGKSKIKIIQPKNILDKWIISKLNSLIKDTTKLLDEYDVTTSARNIELFVVNDLSQWYIRRSRRRFQKPENKEEQNQASQTLSYITFTLAKLVSPFMPFFAEDINLKIGNKKSIHLEDWPKVNEKLILSELEQDMIKIREIVAKALAERAKSGIKVRQPLSKLSIKNTKLNFQKELLDLIKEEINVKNVSFDVQIKNDLELDIVITEELKEEGLIREIIRQIQELRKQNNFEQKDKILIQYSVQGKIAKLLEKQKLFILKETLAKKMETKGEAIPRMGKEIDFEGEKLWLNVKKI